MKNFVREYFDREPVRAAFEEYKKSWESVSDDTQAHEMLKRHANELGVRLEELNKRRDRLYEEFSKHQGTSLEDEAAHEVIAVAMAHTERDIRIFSEVRNDIARGGKNIVSELQKEAKEVLQELNKGAVALVDEDGAIRSDFIKQFYAKSRKQTWERYAAIDALYELGEKFAIDHKDPIVRAYQLAKIPGEIRKAKWKFMLAAADSAYAIDIGGMGGQSIDPNHLELLSGMFARLSDRERGADNPHIPETHKYRHNPAIHSLHTLGLADKLFHDVWREIDHDRGIRTPVKLQYLEKIKQMRTQVFQAALIHDMGEIDGELSQGINVSVMSPDKKKYVKHFREPLENGTFEHYLEAQRPYMHEIKNGKATSQPISDENWQDIKKGYQEAYLLPDKTGQFLGRFFKTLETIQSQQDYLRFQNFEGAKPLIDSHEANKQFSLNYTTRVFYDNDDWTKPQGPNSLPRLAENAQNAIEEDIQQRLAAMMEKELLHLLRQNIESYHGMKSPKLFAYETLQQRRSGFNIAS